ncbi:hypothetical protein [Bradyrhizobium canariense]|uniref:hypothetical protein n=1 Tax=Bradyrhizobium canariense TaxID=255045 RepID=UPI001B8A404B|nr:hypothetical protein [Bradyrhizobium canariense]MBR0954904.1 hypothetical protein [Bradyrhizobium canariense]
MKVIENIFQEFVDAIQTATDAEAFERVGMRLTQRLGFQRFAYLRLNGDTSMLISSYPKSWTGEAYQFDWSHEVVLLSGTTVMEEKLCYLFVGRAAYKGRDSLNPQPWQLPSVFVIRFAASRLDRLRGS